MKQPNKQGQISINSLANASTILLIMKEILSICESQTCANEVLSEQLPKVNGLMETNMNTISTLFGKAAEENKKIGLNINNISTDMYNIELNGKNQSIDNHLQEIISSNQQDLQNKLKEISARIKEKEAHLKTQLQNTQNSVENNASTIGQIVVGMQFQDRVSQNIMITINILKTISSFLEKELSKAIPEVSKDERKKLLNREFAMELLEKFRLGELQNAFANHLVNHGYINDTNEIGFKATDHVKQADSDDVELF